MANQQENEPMFSGLDSFDGDDNSLAASLLTTTGPLDSSPAVSGAFNPAISDWSLPFTDGLPYDSAENGGAFGGLYNPSTFTFQSPWEGSPQFAPQPQQQQSRPQGPAGQFSSDGKSVPVQTGSNNRGVPKLNTGSESPYPGASSTLTLAQQEQLKNIAMPAHLKYRSPKSEGSPQSNGGEPSSPDMPGKSQSSRKRKSSADEEDDDDEDDDGQQPVKKTAHNMIEKRYRTNLNDKIAALRDSVPSLRIMSKSARGEDTTEDREELHGLTPAHKLNKATVLSKATEYIRHLEKRNNRLNEENATMQQRISAFEKLFMHGAMSGTMSPMQQPPTPLQYPQDPAQFVQTPMATPRGPDPQGMIAVPEEMKRILQAQAGNRPYPVPQQPFHSNPAIMRQQIIQQQQQQVLDQSRWQNAGPYFGKLMVGSLAALMVMEAVRESEQSNESPEGRGLFAAPIHFLGSALSSPHFSVGGYYFSTPQVLSSLKLLLIVGSLLWVFVPSLFVSRPGKSPKVLVNNAALRAVPSLASPIHVRRQAWLTAIQTVWVPRHNFFLEAAALMLKTMKLSLRNTIGVHGYQLLTGLTEDQETARVKAWTIALDAQLAGGDVEINKSRLTLTLLASGTLPDTPLRLMLKALHTRVLLLQLSMHGVVDLVAAKVARSKWNEAKELHRMMQSLKPKPKKGEQPLPTENDLPDHLALLLEQDCDSVFSKDIVQRAHNLAWNRPTTYKVCVDRDGMNAVVEDPAVRSPMDAVAAWWSCSVLQEILSAALSKDAGGESAAQIAKKLELATRVAPIGSNAQLRALVARAVLIDECRGKNIAIGLEALAPTLNPDKHPHYSHVVAPLIDSRQPIVADANVQMALRCAMGIAHLQKYKVLPSDSMVIIDSVFHAPADAVSLLGVTAAFILMNRLHEHADAKEQCVTSLERLAGTLRIWIGGSASDSCGLDTEIRQHMVERCLAITKSVMGMESDQGYASMSDCEGEEGGC